LYDGKTVETGTVARVVADVDVGVDGASVVVAGVEVSGVVGITTTLQVLLSTTFLTRLRLVKFIAYT